MEPEARRVSVSSAESNVSRTTTLAGTCTAVFTFTLVFLFPRFSSGELDPILFQAALLASGLSMFSFAYAGMNYYILVLALQSGIERNTKYRRRADMAWQIGFSFLMLQPGLILFSVGLDLVATVFSGLWLLYVIVALVVFRPTHSWVRESKQEPEEGTP